MKRLFRIGAGLFFYSIIPILSWLLLAIILNDSRISNTFSITYAFQFVWAILVYFFGSGANIYKEKKKDDNAVWNSIFWGGIFSVVIFSIPLIFVDNYIAFFGQDVEFYRIFVIYSIILFFLQTVFSILIQKFYFEDKEKTANLYLIIYNLLNFSILILTCLITKKAWIGILVTLLILFIYILFLFIKEFKKFKINFKFIYSFKYESANILSSIFMLLIYLFGFKNAFSAGPEYLLALNFVTLCTDSQWDSLKAISITTKVDISKQRLKYNKHLKDSYIYCLCIIALSVVMVFSLFSLYGVVLEIALIYLSFHVFDMFLHPYKTLIEIYTQLEYSSTINTIIALSLKFIRFLLSILILSPFCTEFGQVTQGILGFIIYLIIRLTLYKNIEGKLKIKSLKANKIK